MHKKVHSMVDSMLKSKSFYPDKSDEERRSIAWAIATKAAKKKQAFPVPENLVLQLAQMHEIEPGFQVAHITFADGRVVQGCSIYNCSEIVLPDDCDLDNRTNQITHIEVV